MQRVLIGSLREDMRAACSQIVRNWGTVAHGTARWTVQLLYRWRKGEQVTGFLGYRRGSSYAGYAE